MKIQQWPEEFQNTQSYTFGRFLWERWWFLLLAIAKLGRDATRNDMGPGDIAAMSVALLLILGGWYFYTLNRMGQKGQVTNKQGGQ